MINRYIRYDFFLGLLLYVESMKSGYFYFYLGEGEGILYILKEFKSG